MLAQRRLQAWCDSFDAITIGRCTHCELGAQFSKSAEQARAARNDVLALVAGLNAARDNRVALAGTVRELQLMVAEQDDIVQKEQKRRAVAKKASREAALTLGNKDKEIERLVRN